MPEEMNSYREMIIDTTGPNFIPHEETNHEEPPNLVAKMFFDMLNAVETPLVEGDARHLVLSACADLLYIKNIWDDEIQEKISEVSQSGLELKYRGYDHFVLAHQAEQVSFLPYPGSKRPRTN
ncbi:hypothetical protein M9H77_07015 [Catharanthus roseus]|uniref:Uncharacterized protein n=1 Tax=Catharanthus roseus TaxID=4058 RepID=A0ACC0BTW4_CATRO|nr:hypothetical protein M9H77_07015 [Catharanthus roseus]